jgi:hypothetical protein
VARETVQYPDEFIPADFCRIVAKLEVIHMDEKSAYQTLGLATVRVARFTAKWITSVLAVTRDQNRTVKTSGRALD